MLSRCSLIWLAYNRIYTDKQNFYMVPFYVGELNQISTIFSFTVELDNVEMKDESVDK